MRFSECFGFKPVKTAIQKESMDQDLRNSLWSALKIHYWDNIQPGIYGPAQLSDYANQELRILCQRLWLNFFKFPLDNLKDDWQSVYTQLRDVFLNVLGPSI